MSSFYFPFRPKISLEAIKGRHTLVELSRKSEFHNTCHSPELSIYEQDKE